MGFSRVPFSCMCIAVFFIAVVSAKNAAPAVDCSSLVMEMADCLSFVTAGGTAQKPEGKCCSGLKTVLKTDADCLCETFRNSAQLGVTLNMTKAVALPSACHVSAPSVSNCALSTGTGAAPGLSPLLAPTSSVTGAPSASISSANDVSPVPAPSSLGASGSPALTTSIGFFALTTAVLAAAISFCLF